jgi:hypothetical protein
MTSIRLSCDVIRFDSDVDHLSAIECPGCRGALALHQPDEAAPDLLLADCQGCHGWLIIDVTEGIIVRLPDRPARREARAALAGPTGSDPPGR